MHFDQPLEMFLGKRWLLMENIFIRSELNEGMKN
jgi:hypothetical protein